MRHKTFNQSGHALLMMMVAIFILLAIGVSLISMSQHVRQQAVNNVTKISARTAADAALQIALDEMKVRLTAAPWDNSALPSGSGVFDTSDESYTYAVTGDMINGHIIDTVGKSGMGESRVTARLKTVSLFEYAILVRESISLYSNTVVDGINYDSNDRPLEIATRSGLNDTVTMNSGASVDGDVLVGSGNDPQDAVKLLPGSIVNGDVGRMLDLWDPPIIHPPATLMALPSLGTLSTSTTITTDSKFDKINLSVNQIVTIDGDVDIYVTGDIILGNDSQIQINAINPNSSLTIYIGGNYEEKQGAAINNLTAEAKRLSMYGLENCVKVDIKNSGLFYGTIYAPNADVNLFNSMEMTGAVVSKSFSQKATGIFHYDADLRTIAADQLGLHFVVNFWSEE